MFSHSKRGGEPCGQTPSTSCVGQPRAGGFLFFCGSGLFYDLDLTVLQVPGLRRREAPAGVLTGLVAVTSPAVVLPPVEFPCNMRQVIRMALSATPS
jgi:hypothetical protein